MVRRALLLVATVLAAVAVAQPAAAKMPYFSIETLPSMPAPGERAEVLLRFWSDPAHHTPAQWSVQAVISDLLCVFPTGHVVTGHAGCPGGIALTLRRQNDSTFAAVFTMPTTGSWTLVAFPAIDRPLPAGYPDQVPIGSPPVQHEPARAHTDSIVWVAGIVLVLLAVSALGIERGRRVKEQAALPVDA